MKKTLLALAFSTTMFSVNTIAADIEASVVKKAEEITNPALADFMATHPLEVIAPSNATPKEAYNSAKQNKQELFSPQALSGPATGITYFEIYAVGSSNVGWEYPSANQSYTSQNHGGSILYTAVLQVGLGNNNGATMNALTKQPFQTQRLCGSDLHNCVAGEIVTGFLYYFNYSGQQSGNFVDSANSVASPFGYWSDSIYIN